VKIAIVGPIESPMRPNSVGGTEMWTHQFAERLAQKGNEVTLFGAEGSQFSGNFVPICSHDDIADKKTGALAKQRFAVFSIEEMLALLKRLDKFDLIHVSYYSFHYFLPFVQLIDKPIVETIHGSPMDYDDLEILFEKYQKPFFVYPSESMFKKWPAPKNYQIISHGIKTDQFLIDPNASRDYLFWMGRIVEQKGVEDAIRVARETNSKLIIAGPKNELAYFDRAVKPYLNDNILYVGELNQTEKIKFYQSARAFLMPVKWEEPFGLVMVEAMACGTPVVAYGRGSISEIVKDEATGFVCEPDNLAEFSRAVEKINHLSAEEFKKMSKNCRARVEEKFEFERMVEGYEALYRKVLGGM